MTESWTILKQVLDDGAFDGGELATFGKYTVSWDTVKGLVAIADYGGWWIMDAAILKTIADSTTLHPMNLQPSKRLQTTLMKANTIDIEKQFKDGASMKQLARKHFLPLLMIEAVIRRSLIKQKHHD